MKSNRIIKTATLLVCALAVGLFSSCSKEKGNGADDTYQQILANIRQGLFDDDGNVLANKLETYETGEYNLIADEEADVRAFFTELTGVAAPEKSEYEYAYTSRDGNGAIRIKGTQIAKDGVFATIYFGMPEIPQIKMIHIGTNAIMGDNNSEDELPGSSDGYTYRIKSYKK